MCYVDQDTLWRVDRRRYKDEKAPVPEVVICPSGEHEGQALIQRMGFGDWEVRAALPNGCWTSTRFLTRRGARKRGPLVLCVLARNYGKVGVD